MAKILELNPSKRGYKRPGAKSLKRTAPKKKRPMARRSGVGKLTVKNALKTTVIPSLTAAGGALALDVVWAKLPIPEQMRAGPARHIAKAAGAIGLGLLAGMFAKPHTANLIATGAVTVVLHNAGRDMLGSAMPSLGLGAYDDDDGYASSGGWYDGGVGAFEDEGGEGMGAYEGADAGYDENVVSI